MKLDPRNFRYLSPDDWRVLAAVEAGSKKAHIVSTSEIIRLSKLRGGINAAQKSISVLAKADLIAREKNMKYDGYRLTYGGFDYLALHAHTLASSTNLQPAIVSLGSQMAVGKESDIYLVTTPSHSTAQHQAILKLHRLGRTSFRAHRNTRTYQAPHAPHTSWHRLSALSAAREFGAMRALRGAGLPVPTPVACNRHAVVMSLVPGTPLRAVPLSAFGAAQDPARDARVAALYAACVELALRLAGLGVIHGDLNEFNVLVEGYNADAEDEVDADAEFKPLAPHLIDFPQVVSLSHPQAAEYFDRDVACLKDFFRKRYHFEPEDEGPTFEDAVARLEQATRDGQARLDVEIGAAGYSKKDVKRLQASSGIAVEDENDQDGKAEELDVSDAESGEEGLDFSIDKRGDATVESDAHPEGSGKVLLHADSANETDASLNKLQQLKLSDHNNQGAKLKAAAGWSI